MEGSFSVKGKLTARLIKAPKAPLSWRLRNTLRWAFLSAWFSEWLAKAFSALTGIMTVTTRLEARLIRADGSVVNYGVVSRKLVTDNGAGFIVDAWQNSVELENMKYHGCGTGNTAESATDSALVTESTTITNPDSTRPTGTTTEASQKVFQTVATTSFDGSGAIVEHGLFSQAATGGGVLFDRSVFSAINVASGDSIQWTYSATFNSGG